MYVSGDLGLIGLGKDTIMTLFYNRNSAKNFLPLPYSRN